MYEHGTLSLTLRSSEALGGILGLIGSFLRRMFFAQSPCMKKPLKNMSKSRPIRTIPAKIKARFIIAATCGDSGN